MTLPPVPPNRDDPHGDDQRRDDPYRDDSYRDDPYREQREPRMARFDAGLAKAYKVMLVLFVAALVIFYGVQLLGYLGSDTSEPVPTQRAAPQALPTAHIPPLLDDGVR